MTGRDMEEGRSDTYHYATVTKYFVLSRDCGVPLCCALALRFWGDRNHVL